MENKLLTKPDMPIIESSTPKSMPEDKAFRKAFVFITTDPEFCSCTMNELRQIEGVSEIYLSRGTYDIVAKVTGESIDQLRDLVFRKIKNMPSIKSTLTLTII